MSVFIIRTNRVGASFKVILPQVVGSQLRGHSYADLCVTREILSGLELRYEGSIPQASYLFVGLLKDIALAIPDDSAFKDLRDEVVELQRESRERNLFAP